MTGNHRDATAVNQFVVPPISSAKYCSPVSHYVLKLARVAERLDGASLKPVINFSAVCSAS
jgi:hypothetical protein